jgi:acid phosphatase
MTDPVTSADTLRSRPVRIQSHPTANGVSDTIRGCQAHMISVPSVFEEPEVIQRMEKAIVQEWFSGYIDKQLGRLSMGRLLGGLQDRFDQCLADASSTPKVGLYACHDTTLAGALKVLDCFDERWPYFTAFLSFELLRKQQASSPLAWIMDKVSGSPPGEENYVRVRYNAKDMHLPACAPAGKHLKGSDGSVCTSECS